jgi:hypothetical protein
MSTLMVTSLHHGPSTVEDELQTDFTSGLDNQKLTVSKAHVRPNSFAHSNIRRVANL